MDREDGGGIDRERGRAMPVENTPPQWREEASPRRMLVIAGALLALLVLVLGGGWLLSTRFRPSADLRPIAADQTVTATLTPAASVISGVKASPIAPSTTLTRVPSAARSATIQMTPATIPPTSA